MDVSEPEPSPSAYLAGRKLDISIPPLCTKKDRCVSPGAESLNGNTCNQPCASPGGNCNLRLPTCSDDDHLDTLNRKVSEIINRNCSPSPTNGNTDVLVGRQYSSETLDSQDQSWSEEDGDILETYNYSLRRRR